MTLYMPLFRSCTTIRSLAQLHAHLVVTGLHDDPQASTKLIESYSEMGSLKSSTFVFKTFQNPDSFMWGVLIKCHVWSRCFEEAISLYNDMLRNNAQTLSNYIFPSVLRAFAGYGDLGMGAKVHGRIVKCGFDIDAVIGTSLIGMYGDLGCLSNARKVFDDMPVKDVVSWSSIASGYIDNGEASKALEMFRLLVSEVSELDSVTMLYAAKACGELAYLRLARSVHGVLITRAIESSEALANTLVEMYSSCGDLLSARKIFASVPNRSVPLWTAMIFCYNQSGWFKNSLEIFGMMLESKVKPNAVTMMAVLNSCVGLGWIREGKSVHCYLVKRCMEFQDDCLGPPLMELYAQSGRLRCCEEILHRIGERNVVSWNMLMSVYAQLGLCKEALTLFLQMQTQGLVPDSFSLSSTISACGDAVLLRLGHQIHGYVITRSIFNEFVLNSLVDMYCKCRSTDQAYLVFDKIQPKSVITWNCMVSGFSQNGKSLEAIHLFDRMYLDHLETNDVTFSSALQACSNIGHLLKGKWLHHKLILSGIAGDLYVDTALTDMYAKCGNLQAAQSVFNGMSSRTVVSWSVMIAGYGIHGHIDAAFSLMNRMVESGIKPNEATFMNILSACSHSGSVEEGKRYFNLMKDFGVEPGLEHFACMVDILSRAGDLNGAYALIRSMPFPADASIWNTLLNGCRIHQRMDMFRNIAEDLSHSSENDSGYYALLSNIYAEEGNFDKSRKVRSIMDRIGLKKVPAYSAI